MRFIIYINYYYLAYAVPYILDAVIAAGHMQNISKIYVQLGFSDSQHHRSKSRSVSPVWPDHFFGIGMSLSELASYPVLHHSCCRLQYE